MRVLMTTDTVGGVWTLTQELTQELLHLGHAVALVSFGREPSERQNEWCEQTATRHPELFLFRAGNAPLEWMQTNVTAWSAGIEFLLDTFKEFQADLLHTHQFCWGAMPGHLPRLITAHSDVVSWAECCRPQGLGRSAWLSHYRSLVQNGLDRAHAVVAPTFWMKSALDRHFDVRCRFTVIPNGRSIAPFSGKDERRLQAATVGRLWDDAKGVSTLLGIDAPLPIFVAGEESFESTSARMGSLQALGPLDESSLFQLFRRSSIYIASSLYEPFGLAPLEAALCGCAVVARNLPSLREVWADTAFFFDTPQELTSLLCDLINNPDLLRFGQERAQARARQFTAARMADSYVALYKTLLSPEERPLLLSEEQTHHAA
jgi:glycogen(starch) synthase